MGSFSIWALLPLLVTAGIVFLVYQMMRGIFAGKGKIDPVGQMICQNCGTRGEPKTVTRGHILIELLLYLMFIIPGLIYSVWRLSTRYNACPSCGQAGMIGTSTPIGRALVEKFGGNN